MSLPHHNPLVLADRFIQLHHMTRGRAMFGACYSALVSDATMIGLDPRRQPEMVEQALDVITRLFNGEIVTQETGWFDLDNARLQTKPYGDRPLEICTAGSPLQSAGQQLAGKFGIGLLSFRSTAPEVLEAVAAGWLLACETASQHRRSLDRSRWRIVGLLHVAETREQAWKDVQFGLNDWIKYFEDVVGLPYAPNRQGDPAAHLVETGVAVIGSPEDCIKKIEEIEKATGGFGYFIISDYNWASFESKLKSYEMIARYILPHFQCQNTQRELSSDWVRHSREPGN